MKCSGFADTKRFRCQRLVSKERQGLGKVTCRFHDDDEDLAQRYSGDRADDQALTQYWLPLKPNQSNQPDQPADESYARKALRLIFGGKDLSLTDLLAFSGLFGAALIVLIVTLSYKILGFGWQPVFTDVGELSSKIVGTVMFAGAALYVVAKLAQQYGREVDNAKEAWESCRAERDKRNDAIVAARTHDDFDEATYYEFLRDRSEFNLSVERTKRSVLSLRRQAIRLSKHASDLEFKAKNPFIEKRTRIRIRKTILALHRGYERREQEALNLQIRNEKKLRQDQLFSDLRREERKKEEAVTAVGRSAAKLEAAKRKFESDVTSVDFHKNIFLRTASYGGLAATAAVFAIWLSNVGVAYQGCQTTLPFFDRCVRVVLEEHNGKKKVYTTIEPVIEVGRVGDLTHFIYADGDPQLPAGDAYIHKAAFDTLSVKTASIVLLEDYDAGQQPKNAQVSKSFDVAAHWSARTGVSSQLTQVNNLRSDTTISHVEESDRISVTPLIRFQPSIQMPQIVSPPGGCGVTEISCGRTITVNNDMSTENYDQRRWVDNSTRLTDRSVHHHEGARLVSTSTFEGQATSDLTLVLNSNFMIDGQPVVLKREKERHLLVPYFVEPVRAKNYDSFSWFFGDDEKINTMVEAFVAGYNSYEPNTWSDRSGVKVDRSYLGLVREILQACSGLEEVPVDVAGYASIKKFKNFSRDSKMHDKLNWALAEGRRARVIDALLDQPDSRAAGLRNVSFAPQKIEKPKLTIYSGPVEAGTNARGAIRFHATYRKLVDLARTVGNSSILADEYSLSNNVELDVWLESQFADPQKVPGDPEIGPKFTARVVEGKGLINAASSLRLHLGDWSSQQVERNDPLQEAFQRGAVISIQTKVLQKCTSP